VSALAADRAMDVRHAESAADIEVVRGLFLEYAASLGFDLAFQDFESEVTSLPGNYAPPRGALLVAMDGATPAGCIALRPWGDADTCEMKRLYVRPAHRRVGLGRILAQALLDEGRRAGYSAMLLDTLDDMEAARELYGSLGFVEVAPYYFNPIPGAHYLKAELK